MIQYLIYRKIENKILINNIKKKLFNTNIYTNIKSTNDIYYWLVVDNYTNYILSYHISSNKWTFSNLGINQNTGNNYDIYYIENNLLEIINNNNIEVISNYLTRMDTNIEQDISNFKQSIELMDIDPSKPIIQDMFQNICYNPLNTIVDKIYFINLDERPDRLHKILKQFNKFNITNFKKIVGINGYKPEYNLLWKQLFIKSNRKITSPGVVGYLLSMKKVLLDAIKNKYNKILILDDDILLHKDIISLTNKIDVIPNNWVLLYLGCSQLKNWNKIEIINNSYYNPKGSCDGSFAIMVSSTIFKELIDLIDNALLPFDTGPLRIINSRYPSKCWVIYPNLIIADVRESNIRTDGGDNYMYNFSRKCRWDLPNYYLD